MATNTTLLFGHTDTNQAGVYSVTVNNYDGSVVSQQVTLTVLTLAEALDTTSLIWTSGGDAPWINQTNFAYDGVTAGRSGTITNSQQSWLETTFVGPARIYFWWKISSENGYDFLRFYIGGVEMTNTSGKVDWKHLSFRIPAGTNAVRWAYMKDESESVGQDAGWVDQLTVVYAPAFSSPPASQTVLVGANVTFIATTTGTAPFDFQWQFNGTNIAGETNSSLLLTNVQPERTGDYALAVSNAAGSVTSSSAHLLVTVPPIIVSQPTNQTVVLNGSASFSITATGQDPLTYQWLLNGTNLAGATGATLLLTNIQHSQVGDYSVIISGPIGSVTTTPARLSLLGVFMLPTVTIEGVVGSNYRIDYVNQLTNSNWSMLTNLSLPYSPYHHLDFDGVSRGMRFYRVVPLP